MSDLVGLEIRDHIGIISMRREAKRNAVDRQLAGLVNLVTDPGGALDGALALASKIVVNAPLSVQACVEAVRAIVGADDALGWEVTQAAMASLSGTADTQEGVRAFLEKRPPVWTGR
jgi:enoyl-CoA hydratase